MCRASAPQAIVRISHQAPHGKTSPLRSGMSPRWQPGACLPDSWCSLRCQPPHCVQQAQGEPPPATQSYKNLKYLMANMPTVCITGSTSHTSVLFTTCQAERTCLGALRSQIQSLRWPTGSNTEQVTCCGQYPHAAGTQAEESSTGHLSFVLWFQPSRSSAGGSCQQHAALLGKHWFGVPGNHIAGAFFSETKL